MVNGKKTYDKEFLMQFQAACTERPESLPDMEIFVVGPAGEAVKPGKGGGPPGLGGGPDEWRVAGRGKGGGPMGMGGGRGNGNSFDPRDPRNNQFAKGGKGRRDQRGPVRGMAFMEVKPLEETENAWKPATKSQQEVDALEKLLRTTKGLLNKFTPEKFEKLTDQFLELEIDSRTDMIAVIDLVFDKALFEPVFGSMYVAARSRPTRITATLPHLSLIHI